MANHRGTTHFASGEGIALQKKNKMFGFSDIVPVPGSTRFCSPFSSQTIQATEQPAEIIMPANGRLMYLFINSSASSGAGKTTTVTVRKNGSDTALFAQLSGATQTTDNNVIDVVTFAQGDRIAIEIAEDLLGNAQILSGGAYIQFN